MSVTTDGRQNGRRATRHPAHDHCVVCGARNDRGLNLVFDRAPDGWVEAVLAGDDSLQGYPRLMHGGVIALLLDAAMTHCLFDRGVTAVTARMEIKFRHPVSVDLPVRIRASLLRSSPPTHQLRAEIRQGDQIKATAAGLFVDRPELVG